VVDPVLYVLTKTTFLLGWHHFDQAVVMRQQNDNVNERTLKCMSSVHFLTDHSVVARVADFATCVQVQFSALHTGI